MFTDKSPFEQAIEIISQNAYPADTGISGDMLAPLLDIARQNMTADGIAQIIRAMILADRIRNDAIRRTSKPMHQLTGAALTLREIVRKGNGKELAEQLEKEDLLQLF